MRTFIHDAIEHIILIIQHCSALLARLPYLTELVVRSPSQHFQVGRAQAAGWPDQLLEDREILVLADLDPARSS